MMVRFSLRLARPVWKAAAMIALCVSVSSPAIAVDSPACGNGLLEAGESCDKCAADCAAQKCSPTATVRRVEVRVTAGPEQAVTGYVTRLAYRSNLVSLPGKGSDRSVQARVKDAPKGAIVAANDRDTSLRVVVSRAEAIPNGPLFAVEFDACDKAAAPSPADFACVVEDCATLFGKANGCECTVTVP